MTAFEIKNGGDGNYRIAGNLTFATASAALRAMAPLFSEGASLRLDLRDVCKADSAGAALLVEWVRRARQSGCELRYAQLPETLLAIIRVYGVDKLLPTDSGSSQVQNN